MSDAREPLSWLTLERYALGELSASERREVEAQLAESATDRAILAEIRADVSQLPPLPCDPPRSLELARQRRRKRAWLALSAGLCAAAALLLVVRDRNDASLGAGPNVYDGIKGADVALRLVSEQQGPEPRSFGEGERFKAEVTCPPALSGSVRLLIFQGNECFEPLPASALSCGNLVPWPGAFTLDGSSPADVCLYWGAERSPKRQARALTCTQLTPR
jgi:predicted nucleic acid-binding protein